MKISFIIILYFIVSAHAAPLDLIKEFDKKRMDLSKVMSSLSIKLNESLIKRKTPKISQFTSFLFSFQLEEFLSGYDLEYFNGSKKTILARDKSGVKHVHEMILYFSGTLLTKMISRSAVGTVIADFKFKKFNKKYLFKEVNALSYIGRQIRESKLEFEYQKVGNNYLPIEVVAKISYQNLLNKPDKKKWSFTEKYKYTLNRPGAKE